MALYPISREKAAISIQPLELAASVAAPILGNDAAR
jgi:hypothetical protein